MSSAGQSKSVVGWKLDPHERDQLLQRFPPRWPDTIADHVTLQARAPLEVPLPAATNGEIVGTADDCSGLEALVVRIGGTVDRPGGGTYHITWSLDRAAGRRPVESNDLLAEQGWKALAAPVPIALRPARF